MNKATTIRPVLGVAFEIPQSLCEVAMTVPIFANAKKIPGDDA
jgi:hypothetical protein